MMTVGLTGGVASGKSAVSEHFARLGVPVIDADVAAREVVEPGQDALTEIVEVFGKDVLDHQGRLDRSRMRNRIFTDPASRKRLESILHPRIRERMREAVESASGPYAVVCIPLLVENQMQDMVSRVLVVDVPESVQRERLIRRNGGNADEANAMIAAQASREQRLRAADDILVNTGTLDDLQHKVETLHRRYLALAAEPENRESPARR